jgi:hypothetical protein
MCFVLLLSGPPRARSATQGVTTIARANTCPRCRIVLARENLVGTEDGPGAVSGFFVPMVSCDGHGHVFATNAYLRKIAMFDSSGNFVRSIGREGRGPGEFDGFVLQDVYRDTLYVFDVAKRRIVLFREDGTVIRDYPWAEPGQGAQVLSRNRFLNLQLYPDGLQARIVDTLGKVIAVPSAKLGDIRGPSPFYRYAPSRNGSIWAAHSTEYVIDRYNGAGTLIETLNVPTPWFEPSAGGLPRSPTGPIISDIQEDENGLLWVVITVPDPEGSSKTDNPRLYDFSGLFDSVIEAIDPVRRDVIASFKSKRAYRRFGCAKTLWTADPEGPNGYPVLGLARVTLTGR